MARFSPDTTEFPICFYCERKLCKTCKKGLASKCGSGKNGNVYYRPECVTCSHARYGVKEVRTNREKDPWKRLSMQIRVEKPRCEQCGFVPEHLGQLDVDHVDGNKKNNALENLMVLCANCHRLKTILNKDWQRDKASS